MSENMFKTALQAALTAMLAAKSAIGDDVDPDGAWRILDVAIQNAQAALTRRGNE